MTLFGIVWIILLCVALWRDIKYMLFLLALSMVFQSADVFSVGTLGIGPQTITCFFFITRCLMYCKGKISLNKKDIFLFLLLIIFGTEIVFSSSINGVIHDNYLKVIQLLLYFTCFFLIMVVKILVTENEVYEMLRTIIIFLVVMGIVQVLTTSEMLPLRSILKVLFYNNDAPQTYFNSSNYTRVMSTFMEPSYFAGIVVGAFYYLLSLEKKWKENFVLMCMLFVELLLTRSSTGYGAFALVGIIFILFSKKIKIRYKMLLCILAIVGAVALYFGFYEMLDKVIFSKLESGSYNARNYMNLNAMNEYYKSKYIGAGYRVVRGSSIVCSLLGELGMIGMVLYLVVNLLMIAPLFDVIKVRSTVNAYQYGMYFAVLSVVVCQLIACPDLDLCTYWFWAFFYALTMRSSRMQREVKRC